MLKLILTIFSIGILGILESIMTAGVTEVDFTLLNTMKINKVIAVIKILVLRKILRI